MFFSFLPWVILGVTKIYLGGTIALIISIIVLLVSPERKRLKKRFLVTWMNLVAMILLLFLTLIKSITITSSDMVLLFSGSFALMAWISIIIKIPFTLQYAKEKISKEKWDSPHFFKVNMIITTIWAVCITISTCATIFQFKANIVSIVVYIFAIIATKKIPSYYRQKYSSNQ